jgi:hypothetical protein
VRGRDEPTQELFDVSAPEVLDRDVPADERMVCDYTQIEKLFDQP